MAHYGCSPTGPLVSHWRAGGHSAVLRCVRTARTALGGRPRYLLCSTQWVLSVTVAAQSSAKLNSGRIRSAQHSAAQRSTAQHSTAQHSRIWQNCCPRRRWLWLAYLALCCAAGGMWRAAHAGAGGRLGGQYIHTATPKSIDRLRSAVLAALSAA